jgi:hypothetical protein
MSLDASVEALFTQLDGFRQLPQYALERRIDVFLSLYLEEYLSTRWEAPVSLVVPEFPLKDEERHRGCNVDYLLRRQGPRPAWVFLELKTAADSVDAARLDWYGEARQLGMSHWRKGLLSIHKAVSGDAPRRRKYSVLLEQLAKAGAWQEEHEHPLPMEVVYLAPRSPLFEDARYKEWVRWLPLEEFARWKPQRHAELWAPVSALLLKSLAA